MGPPSRTEALRALPSVDRLASLLGPGVPSLLAVEAARAEIEAARARVEGGEGAAGADELLSGARARAAELLAPGPRRVINATGVILHTNLGRAPLARSAAAAAAAVATGYSDLEYELVSGSRGSRDKHVEGLLTGLTGAEAATAVNNNAAAVLLALAATAAGGEVIVGRGQLVEIGGSFRIPQILEQSGARLVEVGTTNRTRIGDYEAAITDGTRAILRVHQSNFRAVGFTEEAALPDLCVLGRERGLPVVDDLGSGALAAAGDEPLLRESVAAGATLVCASADKLLGGPQAGLLIGAGEAVERCRAHPLARALRLDKMQLAALAETLRIHRDGEPGEIPALAMMDAPLEDLQRRAAILAEAIGSSADVVASASRPGGGTLPLVELEGPVCSVTPGGAGAEDLAARLRAADPPVIARISGGVLILDPRTMSDDEAASAAAAVVEALGPPS